MGINSLQGIRRLHHASGRSQGNWLLRLATGVLLTTMVLSLWGGALAAPAAAAQQVTLTILHFNDAYDLSPVDKELGGWDRLATLVAQYRQQDPEAVLVFPGDLISPSTMSSLFHGSHMIQGMNLLKADIATFGNHEFDFGPDVLAQRVGESKFTWVITNLVRRDGSLFPGTQALALREIHGVKVGFFGLLTPDTRITSNPGPDVVFADPLASARSAVALLKAYGAEVVVGLTHLPIAEDKQILAEVPEIDLILGGHDHDPMSEEVGGRLVAKAGSDARYLGVATITVEKPESAAEGAPAVKVVAIADKLVPVSIADVQPDPGMQALAQSFEKQMDQAMGNVIAQSTVELDARNAMVRQQEAPLGNLIADAIRQSVAADVAITNGGGIRTNAVLPAGPITRRNVLAWLPFGNRVVKVELTGDAIRQALENGVSQRETGAGRFPQVSGLQFAFDPSKPAGQRVLWVKVNGAPLDPAKTYTVATNDFMLGGGDGYEAFKSGRVLIDASAGQLMDAVVAAYIQAQGTVSPKVEGRIVIQGQ